MENKTKYGIIGALSLLVAFGGYMTLTQQELDNSYYCPSSAQWGIFYGGISSTGYTGYCINTSYFGGIATSCND